MKINAIIFNCTLKKTPKASNTAALVGIIQQELERLEVETEVLRPVDYAVLPGTASDMGPGDDWPTLLKKIKAADIFIVASPVWVGHLSSVAQRVIERLDATFWEEELADKETGQYFTYNKVGGAIVTGNEDGGHEVTGHIVWALQELGFTIPPNANCYWVGGPGPGASYVEAGGEKTEFSNKTALYMANNVAYLAGLLKRHPIPTSLKKLAERAKKPGSFGDTANEKGSSKA